MSTETPGEDRMEPAKKKRRRGVKNEQMYKRNEVRHARLKGKAYVSYKGKLVEEKTTPDAVSCKCRSKCHSKLDAKSISELFGHFYSIGSKDAQDTYLQNWIEVREIKRRTTIKKRKRQSEQPDQQVSDESSIDVVESDVPQVTTCLATFKKNFTFIYNVKLNGRITQICKNTFLQVFGVTESRIRRICDLLVHNKTPCDLRGKNRSVNAIEAEIRMKIHDHISKFQVEEINFAGNRKKFLDAQLNVVKMHEMFINENPDLQSRVKYSYYYQYFKENFDYSFGRPQVDIVSDKTKRPPQPVDEQGPNSAPELVLLKKRAKEFYDALKSASESKDSSVMALAWDYVQNLLVPQQLAFNMSQSDSMPPMAPEFSAQRFLQSDSF